jgi:hypothetical protein
MFWSFIFVIGYALNKPSAVRIQRLPSCYLSRLRTTGPTRLAPDAGLREAGRTEAGTGSLRVAGRAPFFKRSHFLQQNLGPKG